MNEVFKDLFIFEVANNHQGSLDHGLRIVREMAKIVRKYGIHAGVKFQYRELETFIHPDYRDRKDVKHIPRFLDTRLTSDQFQVLLGAVREEGMVTIVTPFDEASVARCIEHGVDVLKVASCSATDWPLLEEVATSGRPVIISTGGILTREIDNVVSFFSHRESNFAIMHCVGMYPTPNDALQLNYIDKMKNRYPAMSVGYSGHEAPDNLDVVKIAVAKGADLLERHVGVPTDSIKLNGYSMSPEQVDAWVSAALAARCICGTNGSKQVTQSEVESLRSLKRGVFAQRAIEAGARICRDDVFFSMPCVDGQLTSGEFGRYRAQYIASRDYKANEPLFEYCQPDEIGKIRTIIHDIKGMLYEAKIELGSEVEIELSHHYGIDQFRRIGCAIVNVVNRDYCKKLILVFPGQKNPRHAHKIKEETFQVLWGDLQVEIDGKTYILHPGDKMLVEPGQMHSFQSGAGAIFEEISTTHQRNDSYYADDRINTRDSLERKTLLQEW